MGHGAGVRRWRTPGTRHWSRDVRGGWRCGRVIWGTCGPGVGRRVRVPSWSATARALPAVRGGDPVEHARPPPALATVTLSPGFEASRLVEAASRP
eukprot:6836155-Prymnesium_polylepis.1